MKASDILQESCREGESTHQSDVLLRAGRVRRGIGLFKCTGDLINEFFFPLQELARVVAKMGARGKKDGFRTDKIPCQNSKQDGD